jgi:predicted transcriptional regulator
MAVSLAGGFRLDDELMKAVKKEAASSGRTLTRVVEDALRESLARRTGAVRRQRVVLKDTDCSRALTSAIRLPCLI